jgi:FtsH-binding integral membrane protein
MHQSEGYVMPTMVADVSVDARTAFIRRTYAHLTGAIFAFAGVSWFFFQFGVAQQMLEMMGQSAWAPLAFFAGFVAVSWMADSWARSDRSTGMQYLGLGVYVVAEALFFAPMLLIAVLKSGPENNIVYTASIMTLAIFGGLTVFVLTTKKDFSFMRGILAVGSMVAFGLILCSFLFGLDLGMIFTVAMIALAAGYILYYTSNVMHHYQTHQHVAASLALFAAVALLFWYVLRLFMNRD